MKSLSLLFGGLGVLAVLEQPVVPVAGLLPSSKNHHHQHRAAASTLPPRQRLIIFNMGLYDTPLPPRPSPKDDPSSKDDDDDDDEEPLPSAQRLFRFNLDGTEQQGLLPRLGRSLESGIGCYLESSDRKVQNLVSKTECHPDDAAWALEACRGDITEAWTRISTARRMMLNRKDVRSVEEKADSAASTRDELETFKEKLKRQEQKLKRDQYFTGGKPDGEWLPLPNPKPIDDEPWFTG